jgi:hypothetical protein
MYSWIDRAVTASPPRRASSPPGCPSRARRPTARRAPRASRARRGHSHRPRAAVTLEVSTLIDPLDDPDPDQLPDLAPLAWQDERPIARGLTAWFTAPPAPPRGARAVRALGRRHPRQRAARRVARGAGRPRAEPRAPRARHRARAARPSATGRNLRTRREDGARGSLPHCAVHMPPCSAPALSGAASWPHSTSAAARLQPFTG